MKQAHKYNLKATFSNGVTWDLNILAVSASWLFCWINEKQSDILDTFKIELLERNVTFVKSDFGAIAYNEDGITLPNSPKLIIS